MEKKCNCGGEVYEQCKTCKEHIPVRCCEKNCKELAYEGYDKCSIHIPKENEKKKKCIHDKNCTNEVLYNQKCRSHAGREQCSFL